MQSPRSKKHKETQNFLSGFLGFLGDRSKIEIMAPFRGLTANEFTRKKKKEKKIRA